jgi:hypothetical protein
MQYEPAPRLVSPVTEVHREHKGTRGQARDGRTAVPMSLVILPTGRTAVPMSLVILPTGRTAVRTGRVARPDGPNAFSGPPSHAPPAQNGRTAPTVENTPIARP